MSEAEKAMNILKKNLSYEGLEELIVLIQEYLEVESQEFMKAKEGNKL